MDGQLTLGSRVNATQSSGLRDVVGEIVGRVKGKIVDLVEQFATSDVTPLATIKIRQRSYRRLADKSPNSNIVTPFGRISLRRARYRQGSAGRIVFPLEIALGIDQGFTPAAADMEPHREGCQLNQVMEWIKKSREGDPLGSVDVVAQGNRDGMWRSHP